MYTSQNLPATLELADLSFLSFDCLAQVTACRVSLAATGSGSLAAVGRGSLAAAW